VDSPPETNADDTNPWGLTEPAHATEVSVDTPPGDAGGSGPPGAAWSESTEGEPAPKGKAKRAGWLVALEWALLIIAALTIALVIKTFLFQAFYIPSGSMLPTLEQNDRVLVNKLSYHMHPVHRGDIIVFKAPPGTDPSVKDLVKRVIGLPGDKVEARDGQVYINGQPLKEPYLPAGTRTDCASFTEQCFLTKLPPSGVIPPNHYWVMGDNRPSSKDSRFFGPIAKSDIVGRVFIRIWPLNRLDLL
jgi:signal peptidase I